MATKTMAELTTPQVNISHDTRPAVQDNTPISVFLMCLIYHGRRSIILSPAVAKTLPQFAIYCSFFVLQHRQQCVSPSVICDDTEVSVAGAYSGFPKKQRGRQATVI